MAERAREEALGSRHRSRRRRRSSSASSLAMVVVVLVNVVVGAPLHALGLDVEQALLALAGDRRRRSTICPSRCRSGSCSARADPLEQSVKQLLVAYQAETTKLDVHYVDPDRDAVALEDVQEALQDRDRAHRGRHVVTDAIVVVARGDKHWFLTDARHGRDLGGDDTQVKPTEERALTGAIRNVLGGEKTRSASRPATAR